MISKFEMQFDFEIPDFRVPDSRFPILLHLKALVPAESVIPYENRSFIP